jgi:hypothetical protein
MITFGLNGAAASASAVRIYCRSAERRMSNGRGGYDQGIGHGHISFGR